MASRGAEEEKLGLLNGEAEARSGDLSFSEKSIVKKSYNEGIFFIS